MAVYIEIDKTERNQHQKISSQVLKPHFKCRVAHEGQTQDLTPGQSLKSVWVHCALWHLEQMRHVGTECSGRRRREGGQPWPQDHLEPSGHLMRRQGAL